MPFGSENHFPESKLKEAQEYTDRMNKKLVGEEKKRKIAKPSPLTVRNEKELNALREGTEHYSSREEAMRDAEKYNREEKQPAEDTHYEKMLKNSVGDKDVGYHLEIGPTTKGIGFKKVKNHSLHYSSADEAKEESAKYKRF